MSMYGMRSTLSVLTQDHTALPEKQVESAADTKECKALLSELNKIPASSMDGITIGKAWKRTHKQKVGPSVWRQFEDEHKNKALVIQLDQSLWVEAVGVGSDMDTYIDGRLKKAHAALAPKEPDAPKKGQSGGSLSSLEDADELSQMSMEDQFKEITKRLNGGTAVDWDAAVAAGGLPPVVENVDPAEGAKTIFDKLKAQASPSAELKKAIKQMQSDFNSLSDADSYYELVQSVAASPEGSVRRKAFASMFEMRLCDEDSMDMDNMPVVEIMCKGPNYPHSDQPHWLELVFEYLESPNESCTHWVSGSGAWGMLTKFIDDGFTVNEEPLGGAPLAAFWAEPINALKEAFEIEKIVDITSASSSAPSKKSRI